MLKLWGRRNSSNVQKVAWTLGEIGMEHEHIDAGGRFGGLDEPQFLAMNPNGLIPVLDDHGTIVWESNAIVRYLSCEYAPGRLWSNSVKERASADRWMDWAATTFQPAFTGFFWGWYRTPATRRDATLNADFLARTVRCLELLDFVLKGRDFLANDHLTMADIPIGAMLYRYFTLEIDRPALPNVSAWYSRLTTRDAYREHVMRPYGELFGRLTF